MSALPWLLMTGRVCHVFITPEREGKDGKYGGDYKVQLLVDKPQENGEVKRDIVDLKTQYPDYFSSMDGREVSLPVGDYAYKGEPGYYILKTWKPPVSDASQGAPVSLKDAARGELA